MARFYQTSDTQAIDYIPNIGTGRGTGAGKTKSPFGEFEVIPEDRPLLQQKMGEYYAEVQDITNQLRQNPKDLVRLQPRISDLRSRMQQDIQAGEIAAMRERRKQYDALQKSFGEAYKNNPLEHSYAMSNIEVQPLDYDPVTGTFGSIMAPKMASPWDPDEWDRSIKNAEANLTPRLLEEARTKNIPINKYANAMQIMNTLGYTKDQALQAIMGNLSPELVDSYNQHYRLRGVDMPKFSVNGQLNLEHPLARQLDQWASAKEGVSDMRIATPTAIDYGRKAAAEESIKARYDKDGGENSTASYYAEGFRRVMNKAKQGAPTDEIPGANAPIPDSFLKSQVVKIADNEGKSQILNLDGTVIRNGVPYAVVKDKQQTNQMAGEGAFKLDIPMFNDQGQELIEITPEFINSILGDKDFRDFWGMVRDEYSPEPPAPQAPKAQNSTPSSSTLVEKLKQKNGAQ